MRFYLGQSWRRLFFCNYIWRVQNKKLTKVDASYEDHLTPTIPNMNTQSFSSSSHILVWVIHWNKKKLLLRISVTCVNSFNKSIHLCMKKRGRTLWYSKLKTFMDESISRYWRECRDKTNFYKYYHFAWTIPWRHF